MPLAGVPLCLAIGKVSGSAAGGTAPEIELAPTGEAPQDCTDDGGRVFWDEIRVVQGTGAPFWLGNLGGPETLDLLDADHAGATEQANRG